VTLPLYYLPILTTHQTTPMRYLLLFLVFCCAFCTHKNPENELTITVEKIALRTTPGVKSAEIAILHEGDKVLDLGIVSNFESEIVFAETPLRTPWLKVKTADNQEGWLFAGAAKPKGEAAAWLRQKRLDCYFGHVLSSRLKAWKTTLNEVQTEAQCAFAFRTGIAIRDSMAYLLAHRTEPNGRPDFSWLSEELPGFVCQASFTSGPPDLFADYRFWWPIALKTSGGADDFFLSTSAMAFPHDSIESLFPVWKFQLSEVESASQLGAGMHLKMLLQIDKTLAKSRLFEPELITLKDQLLDDIHDKNTRFWQAKDLILKELDDIIAAAPTCLSEAESSALLPRRVMLEDPEKNGVRVNLRSGE
jgi:hypothetical protein